MNARLRATRRLCGRGDPDARGTNIRFSKTERRSGPLLDGFAGRGGLRGAWQDAARRMQGTPSYPM